MNWTDCPIIEQIPGKVSGAPVLRGTRLRAEDITGNAEMGVAWIADSFGIPAEKVRIVLEFWHQYAEELEIEYFSPEWIEAHGANLDWSDCPDVTRSPAMLDGAPTVHGTNVRPIDLIGNRGQGEGWLAQSYELPVDTIRSVLNYYDQHHRQRQLAPAV
jgi:uncharacterized protein (DUF433 family)